MAEILVDGFEMSDIYERMGPYGVGPGGRVMPMPLYVGDEVGNFVGGAPGVQASGDGDSIGVNPKTDVPIVITDPIHLPEATDTPGGAQAAAQRLSDLQVRQYITGLYQQLLGRAPDAPGLDFWANVYDNGSHDESSLLTAFLNSDEYKAHQAAGGGGGTGGSGGTGGTTPAPAPHTLLDAILSDLQGQSDGGGGASAPVFLGQSAPADSGGRGSTSTRTLLLVSILGALIVAVVFEIYRAHKRKS